MDTPKHTNHDNPFWVGIFLGGLLGALLIVLFGTEKGKRLIKKFEEEGLDFLDHAKDTIDEKKVEVAKEIVEKVISLEGKGEDLVEKGREFIEEGKFLDKEVLEKVAETKEDIAGQAVAQADRALAHIEALQERGRASTAELRKRMFKNIPKKS